MSCNIIQAGLCSPSLLDFCSASISFLLCHLVGLWDDACVSCTGVTSAILTPPHRPGWIPPRAVCFSRSAAGFVCGRLSVRPGHRDERHLDLPIHFTFAPINYSTGQPIKNEGERSGPRPPKAATRQLSPWIIGAINLALSNKGVLTLRSPSISHCLYAAQLLITPVITDTHHNNAHTAAAVTVEHWWTCLTRRLGHRSQSQFALPFYWKQ